MLPIELQRIILIEQLRAAVEVRDYADAVQAINELDTIGVPGELAPTVAVLAGRLAEATGRISDALKAYGTAATSADGPAAAQGRMRDVALRYSLKRLERAQAIAELETLTTMWRGDETEIEALSVLERLYLEEKRYRDAFYVMRTAIKVFPQFAVHAAHPGRGGGELRIAVPRQHRRATVRRSRRSALFYDFRELTPPAGAATRSSAASPIAWWRSISSTQAAELLQHQVDNRLQGAARSQVAARLAVVYLMNHKPDRALQRPAHDARGGPQHRAAQPAPAARGAGAVRYRAPRSSRSRWSPTSPATRSSGCAPTSCGRRKRWRDAGEQIEKLYGERWRELMPLTEVERPDILRAAIAFALAEDQLATDRLREKYGAKMAEGPLRARVRDRDDAVRRQRRGVPRRRQAGGRGRHARAVLARRAGALSRAAIAGRPGAGTRRTCTGRRAGGAPVRLAVAHARGQPARNLGRRRGGERGADRAAQRAVGGAEELAESLMRVSGERSLGLHGRAQPDEPLGPDWCGYRTQTARRQAQFSSSARKS